MHFELDARGVYLIWESEDESEGRSSLVKLDYRVYRREKGSRKHTAVPYLRAVVHTPEGERWTAVDTTIEWERTYLYSVTPVTYAFSREGRLISEREGGDSAPIEVVAHDIFPPAPPERLLAIVGRNSDHKFVDLLWAPNTEKDISTYNVYRREETGQSVRINSAPITMLSFQDTQVSPGHTYLYRMTAVDLRGNESGKSDEAAAVVP